MNEIKMIDIKSLHPHPDNPRKQIGDLQELSESIRKNGIMQNLTVVEGHYKGKEHVPGDYTIIIGHRRCVAARKAGLTEVPCIIADLDQRQQLCTMMEENMQRQDLTIPEQAYGFQYMLDLGESVEDIAKKTGFAESTVKHRLEIAKLDKKTLQCAMNEEVTGWQMTLKDIMEMEKIKDIETRNKILKRCTSGRAAFRNMIQSAIRDEEQEEIRKKWMPLLEKAEIKPTPKDVNFWSSGWQTVKSIDLDEKKVPKKLVIKDYDKEEPLYFTESYGNLYIMQKVKEKKKTLSAFEIELKKKKAAKKELKKKLEAACKSMRDLARAAYFTGIESSMTEEKTIEELWKLFVNTRAYLNRNNLTTLSDAKKSWDVPREEIDEYAAYLSEARKVSEQMLVYLADNWSADKLSTTTWQGSYNSKHGETLLAVYKTLNQLYGFELRDPEFMKILDGTHELYEKGQEA